MFSKKPKTSNTYYYKIVPLNLTITLQNVVKKYRTSKTPLSLSLAVASHNHLSYKNLTGDVEKGQSKPHQSELSLSLSARTTT